MYHELSGDMQNKNIQESTCIILNNKATHLIQDFITSVDADFSPKLSSRVNISTWSRKLNTKAINIAKISPDGEIKALISFYVNKEESYIAFIAVSKKERGQNIATELILECVNYCKLVKSKSIKVETWLKNKKMLQIYYSLDFKPEEVIDNRDDDSSIFLKRYLL